MNQTDRALESKSEAQKTEEETFRRLLLGIDLQNDFCHPEGKLAVKGAKEDLERIINLIEMGGEHFNEVIISMDSHYPLHIAHPSFWRNQAGEMPEPFTIITYDEVIKISGFHNIIKCRFNIISRHFNLPIINALSGRPTALSVPKVGLFLNRSTSHFHNGHTKREEILNSTIKGAIHLQSITAFFKRQCRLENTPLPV